MLGFAFIILILIIVVLYKFNFKSDNDLTLDQSNIMEIIKVAVVRVDEINADLLSSGGISMTPEEKLNITIELAKDLIMASGIPEVKTGLLSEFIRSVSNW